jgi:hypothetical protein
VCEFCNRIRALALRKLHAVLRDQPLHRNGLCGSSVENLEELSAERV